VAWKCLVACLLGESSQQPTWPQVRQIRKCSHTLPLFRHSSQPSALGVTLRMPAMWVQPFAIRYPLSPKSDSTELNRILTLSFCLSMIFSENRLPLFRIML
jgi:hypothetical protein